MFWVHASNAARFEQSYKELADKLELRGRDGGAANVMQLVRQWLSTEMNGRWLMIVDNVDDETLIKPLNDTTSLADFIPQSDNGAVLFTSRNREVARQLADREKDLILVNVMESNEALALLHNKLTALPDKAAAEALVTALDCVPLAIAHAAAYMNRLQTSCALYLQTIKAEADKVETLGKIVPNSRRGTERAAQSVLATWDISFTYIETTQPSAADLLSFLSFLMVKAFRHQ